MPTQEANISKKAIRMSQALHPAAHRIGAAAAATLPQPHVGPAAMAAAAALVGAITGDAAAQTSHWNYKRDVFHRALVDADRMDNPEFFPFNSFYTVSSGGQSCYGDQLIEVARHLASSNDATTRGEGGNDDIDIALTSPEHLNNLVGKFETAFGSQSAYGPWPVDPNYKPKVPIQGPWRHASIKGFLTNLSSGKRSLPECGSDDAQADAIAKSIPVVCVYAGRPDLLDRVETAVRLTQNSDRAVEYAKVAALFLEKCILGTAASTEDGVATNNIVIDALTSALQDKRASFGNEALELMSLVVKILKREPSSSFDEAVDMLSKEPIMKPLLQSPVSLVA